MRGVQHPSARQDVDRADVLVAGQSRFGRLHNSLMQLLTIGVQISDSFRRSFALIYTSTAIPFSYRFSQLNTARFTFSGASCCAKWPASGIVTKVQSSTHSQVPVNAPGNSAQSFRP